MLGETDLKTLIRSMRPLLRAGTYVFVTVPSGGSASGSLSPLMVFQEDEGQTLILAQEDAAAAGLAGAVACRMITLQVNSSLEAIGFLAAVAAPLAAAGIAVNAVSAFHHDHLFVPVERAHDALRMLEDLARA